MMSDARPIVESNARTVFTFTIALRQVIIQYSAGLQQLVWHLDNPSLYVHSLVYCEIDFIINIVMATVAELVCRAVHGPLALESDRIAEALFGRLARLIALLPRHGLL